jgi:hypothetical protein
LQVLRFNRGTDRIPALDQVSRSSAGDAEMSKAPTTTVAPVDGRKLLRAIKKFQRESLAGTYYAPFNMNSKNYMFIPPETEARLCRCRLAAHSAG